MERLASDCPNARTGARADRARIHKDAGMDEPRPVSIWAGIDVSKDRLDVHLRRIPPQWAAFSKSREV